MDSQNYNFGSFIQKLQMNCNSKINFLSLLCKPFKSFGSSKNIFQKLKMPLISRVTIEQQILSKKLISNQYFNHVNATRFSFCTQSQKKEQGTKLKKGPLKPEQIPQQNLQVVATQQKIDQQDVQVFHTKGTLSILDKVPGIKHQQSGQLFVLMFTCTVCQTKSIRSFTKNAYHKGVVMVRCNGCDNVHLVADNLGWFQDEPTNIETMHKGKVKRVHDQGAINMFLKKAFEQQQVLLNPNPHHHHQNCSHQHHNHQNKQKSQEKPGQQTKK